MIKGEIPLHRIRVLALDPALSTGVAAGEVGNNKVTPWLATWDLRERGGGVEGAFGRAARLLQMRITLERPDVLAIEQPIAPHRLPGQTQYATTLLTHGLYGLYTGLALAHRIQVMPVASRTWRKAILGRGSLNRNDAKRAACKFCTSLRWDAKDDDQAEAAGIWLWACGELRAGALAARASA